ncbi:hypothetical protein PPERSA_08563 [Pseudocohnilembus persalinus]|uniref:Dynein heavy chain AAA lid domain-containing protein n=1 Tax=Pseudocohnilembus persalinus TaxID=266149 RepID=A0A0V0R724_PSEPJ|nr:hypothetical protein PPERSA_08563 [Pseudocohnilembus persalinus]|eukprot:KRX10160.1 hypothetical protein PPERSA_08563 [Pseudocohnilembus persalinus]
MFINLQIRIGCILTCIKMKECCYGGIITENQDLKLIENMLKNSLNSNLFRHTFQIDPLNVYKVPQYSKDKFWNYHIECFNKYPVYDPPLIFGLHQNAEIKVSIEDNTRFLSQN